MEETHRASIRRRDERVIAVVWLGLCAGSVLLPVFLTPDTRGYGTHEQFFLYGCLFRKLTTLPCPMCGLTTSFAHLVRGELAEAFRCHPAGPLLYPCFCAAGLYALVWAITGWNPLRGRLDFLTHPRAIPFILVALWIPALIVRFFVR
jgi:hypothetical protein